MSKLTKNNIYKILSSDMYSGLSHLDNYSVPIGNNRGRLVDLLAEKLELTSLIELYALDRIIFGQTDLDAELDYSIGYYDAYELTSISLNKTWGLADKLFDFLKLKSFNQQVEWLLNNEYGYILDALQNANYKIEKIFYSDLIFGAKDHYHSLDQDRVKRYKERLIASQLTVPVTKKQSLSGLITQKDKDTPNIWQSDVPRGIVQYMPSSGLYRVVDGYHRLSASKGEDKVQVIVAS